MSEQLLLCPFCSGEAELKTSYDTEYVVCKECGAMTNTFCGDYYDEGSMDGFYVTTAYGQLDIRKCSNCNEDITIDDHDSFCPSCGADMRKEEV